MRDIATIKKENALAVIEYRINDIIETLEKNNGITLNIETLKAVSFENGFQVSFHEIEKTEINDIETIKKALLHCMMKYTDKSVFIGIWINKKTKNVEIDMTTRYEDKKSALILARFHNQKAVYDWKKQKSIYLKSI